ncbi:MAG TPA: VOC family protein [Candidatus Dormibacteraeota bacterium]|nr:VOC family protein [Candidatus Dormibacteraeota bacterium]
MEPKNLSDASVIGSKREARMHHVGYVVPSIAEAAKGFAESLSGSWDEIIFADPLQCVRVTFLTGSHAADPLVELIEPAGEKSPVMSFLKKGGGLHHLCYEVNSLEHHLDFMRSAGGKIVRPPMPAVAFDGRRIAWVYTKYRLLVELLETKNG